MKMPINAVIDLIESKREDGMAEPNIFLSVFKGAGYIRLAKGEGLVYLRMAKKNAGRVYIDVQTRANSYAIYIKGE